MDEQVWMHGAERRRAVELLIQQVVRSIEAAKQHDTPFYHLRFDHFSAEHAIASGVALDRQAGRLWRWSVKD